MLVEVQAPDTAGSLERAYRLAAVSTRLAVASAPPSGSRLSDVLGEVRADLFGSPLGQHGLPQDGDGAIRDLACLHANGVRDLLVVHGRWLTPKLVGPLDASLASVGIRLFVLAEPDDDHEAFLDWREGEITLDAFEKLVVQTAEQTGGTSLRWGDKLPRLAITAPASASNRELISAPIPLAAYRAVRHEIRDYSSAAVVARVLRSLLAEQQVSDRQAVLEGSAAGLEEAGYLLRWSALGGTATWHDLLRIREPLDAAVLALHALGIAPNEASQLRVSDIDPRGEHINLAGRQLSVDGRAVPLLRAQRLARLMTGGSDGDPFLSGGTLGLGSGQVIDVLVRAVRAIGQDLHPDEIDGGMSRARRWLLERGVAFRRIREPHPAVVQPTTVREARRRCRHGLTPLIELGATVVSHSQRLCRAAGVEETRGSDPAFAFALRERDEVVSTWTVSRDGAAVGTAWSVATPLGRLWLQSHEAETPPAGDVANGVLNQQLAASRTRV